MKIEFGLRATLTVLSLLITLGCQNQTGSTSKANVSSANSNTASQSSTETKIPEPQTVKFVSADNVEIVGTFYEAPKANSPAVLMLHQWQSDRQSYDELARKLQAKGFGVLAIDGRGFGESVKKLKESVPNEKYETQIYPKGGHGTTLFSAKVGLEDLLEKFLTKSL